MKPTKLSRRAMLRGLGGAAVGLPALEIMLGSRSAQAQAATPNRYVVMFGGHSLGTDRDWALDYFSPTATGQGYPLSPALLPLGDLGVQNEVSVVSGLKIPWAGSGAVPPGGRDNGFHAGAESPLLSGVRSNSSTAQCNGPSSDQVVADAIAGSTTFKSLVFRAQVGRYSPFTTFPPGDSGVISWARNPSGAPLPLQPQTSPQAAFNALFFNLTAGLSPDEIARRNFLLRKRKSVLDFVIDDTQRLMPTLGSADRVRIQKHLDEIRALELQVAAVPPLIAGACQRPADPGPDPAVGTDATDVNMDQRLEFTSVNTGWSDEDTRARVMCDLIHMAFACDLSRVASLQLSHFASAMNAYAVAGVLSDFHFISHGRDGAGSSLELCSKLVAWHVKHFAYLVSKLLATPEAGGTMLDHAALVYVNEGGRGFDPAGSPGSHSTENMGALIAGRAGGLKPGQHVAAAEAHPAQVLASAMTAVGVPGGLGEVQGTLPQLFS